MFFKLDYRLRLCVWLVLINLLDVIECRKDSLLNNLKLNYDPTQTKLNSDSSSNIRKRDVNDNANSFRSTQMNVEQIQKNFNSLASKAKQSTIDSLNNYLSFYNNLLKKETSKRTTPIYRPAFSSHPSSSFRNLRTQNGHQSSAPVKRTDNQLDETIKTNSLNTNISSFLNLVTNWKKQQPTCGELKSMWSTSINRLTEYFLNNNNELFMQPHLNMMDNPIYIALLIGLSQSQHPTGESDKLMIDSRIREEKNKPISHMINKQNDQPSFKQSDSKSPLTMDFVAEHLMNRKEFDKHDPKYLNEKTGNPYVWKYFKKIETSDPSFIPSPQGRHYQNQEILDDGPMIIYETESDNDPSSFWGDSMLSKPVKKPGAYLAH